VLVSDKNLFIAEVCHIEAAAPGGERYNPDQTQDERRAYENLVILCHPHHVETDNVAEYPAGRLRKLKMDHEASFGQHPYKIDESLLYKISVEMDQYWSDIDFLHNTQHVAPSLSVPVNVRLSYQELADEMDDLLRTLSTWRTKLIESNRRRYADVLAVFSEVGVEVSALGDERAQRLSHGDWLFVNLALPNHVTRLRALLVQMELQYLEAYLKLNPTDAATRLRLASRKAEFALIATKQGLAD
jgi:hypothetical protein